jgi:hypothetical protein
MREKLKKYLLQVIALTGLLYMSNDLYCQKKYEISGGFGWPDLFSLNCRHGSDFQYGIGVGFLRMKDSFSSNNSEITYWNFSADTYDHFGGRSELTSQMPWYINIGASLTHVKTVENAAYSEAHTSNDTFISLYTRIGRSINLSEKFGLTADLGVYQSLNLKDNEKIIPIMILPAFSTRFFMRL